MTLLTALVPLVRPYVADCPRVLIENELLRAARRFCDETQVLREKKLIGFGGTDVEVRISRKETETVMNIISVRKRGETNFLSIAGSADSLPVSTGTALYYASSKAGHIKLGPIPATSEIFEVYVVLKPSLTATEINTDLAEVWGEAIAAGAASNLMLMPDSQWYNPQGSAEQKRNFETAVTKARIRISTGNVNSSRPVSGGKFI